MEKETCIILAYLSDHLSLEITELKEKNIFIGYQQEQSV